MTYNLLKLSLTLHIIGITMTTGSMLMSYVVYRKFRREYFADRQRALWILNGTGRFPMVAAIGMAVLVVSGISMMILTQGVYMNTLWFKLKLGIIVSLILNGMLVTRRLKTNLDRLVRSSGTFDEASLKAILKKLDGSMVFQLLLFVLIFALASFRFT
jgi:hypothetical protein